MFHTARKRIHESPLKISNPKKALDNKIWINKREVRINRPNKEKLWQKVHGEHRTTLNTKVTNNQMAMMAGREGVSENRETHTSSMGTAQVCEPSRSITGRYCTM